MANRSINGIPVFRLGITLLTALAAACGGTAENTADDSADLAVDNGYVHKMPYRSETERAAFQQQADAIINTAGAHLSYFGGKVVQNAKVVQVLYGTGTYISGVSSSTAPNMGTFYGGVLASPYVDWLVEYNTSSPVQHIGRGTFNSKKQITPAASRNGSTISDSSIKAEISAQITAGHLPAADNNTIYMINFPKGKHISQGGSKSCQAGGFCAYHGTFKKGTRTSITACCPI